MSARRPALLLCLLLAGIGALAPAGAQAAFGVKSFSAIARTEAKLPDTQAGDHPYEFTVSLEMNQDLLEHPEGTLSALFVDLPVGMVGNPQALPRCPRADFDSGGLHLRCPGSTQVGVADLQIEGLPLHGIPIYNLTPDPGFPATLGLSIEENNSLQDAGLRTGSDYGVTVSNVSIPTKIEVQSVTEHIWGVPMATVHDPERSCLKEPENFSGGGTIRGCPSDAARVPFLTLPGSCAGQPLLSTLRVESVQGDTASASASMPALEGCEALRFAPTIKARPETAAADSPTGLAVAVHIPQDEAPEQLASAELRDSVVTLPAGLAVNPSGAIGRGACSLAQIDLRGPGAANCPAASKVGTVTVKSPLVDHPLPGAVYLAKQGENPFGSLLALYIAVEDPLTGVIVKLAGEVEAEHQSGQLRASFKENPQLPFEDLELSFFGGPRATLTTPPTCGPYTTQTDFTPWSAPEAQVAHPSDSFAISEAASGGPCPASEAQMPNAPGFEAGAVVPLAGAYSPFALRLNREDGSQRLGALDVTLPAGLSARLAGLAECSEAQIAAATARSGPGEGALEQRSPSCPAASEVGSVEVGAGSGTPLAVQGRAYLSGPYKGAPLSLAIITPAVAGPFDLGVVVVRAALFVNQETAQVTVKSDPLPTILQGIPLGLRSLVVRMDRPDFTLNPTNCSPTLLSAQALSPLGLAAALASPFQVGGCRGLGFAPKLALSLEGPTKRSGHPALKAVVTYPKQGAYANIASAQVGLPHSEFLDQGNLDRVCTQPELRSNTCPKSSVYGHAKAWTPLLEKPLEGPVYLGVGFGHKLPDLVADLNGQIRILLHGKVDTTKQDGIRNTFEVVPDAPVSKFVLEMKGGKKYGLLENSENVCLKPQLASARFVAQNGLVAQLRPKIANGCGGTKSG